MNFKKTILTLIAFTAILVSCSSQKEKLKKLDQSLTRDFVAMIEADPDVRFDSLAPLFKKRLKTELTKPGTFKYPFDSLSKKLSVVTTDDGKFRTFSWDEQGGGRWNIIAVFGQYKTKRGRVAVQVLSSIDEMEEGGYTDSYIFETHTLNIDGKTHYLTLGSGTLGSNFIQRMVQIFKIEGDSLVSCGSCFEENWTAGGRYDYLAVEARRWDNIDLKFNPETNEITFNEYVDPGTTHPGEPPVNAVTLKLVDGVFRTISSVKLSDEEAKNLREKSRHRLW